MASFYNLSIPDLLRDARDLYTNARDDAEAFAVLSAAPWSFTAADFDAGLALVAAVETAQRDEGKETLESREATTEYGAAVRAVDKTYARYREQARAVYRRGTPMYGALKLAGEAPDDREDLLTAAAGFFDTVAGRPDVIGAVRGFSDDGFAAAQALVADARAAGTKQTKEKGDVDRVSATRKAAIQALRDHAALTASDASHALSDHPQLRERLGLLER